jgi:uncharacterized protein involved in response to NO
MAWGVVAPLGWVAAPLGLWPSGPYWLSSHWHGHEMVFGFAVAIVAAVLLTAIPGWAATDEIAGGRLAALVAAWLAGRLAVVAVEPGVIWAVLVDCSFLPLLAAFLAPTLARARDRRFLAPVALVAVLAVTNGLFHYALALHGAGAAAKVLTASVLLLMVLYSVVAGLFIPVFTGTRLGVTIVDGRLGAVAVASIAAFAAGEMAVQDQTVRAALAGLAAALNGLRLARWRGWHAGDDPLLWSLHLGYAWLPVALGLRAAGALGSAGAEAAWVHAFTIGALGITILGLATRMALRHTGRPLVAPHAMVAAYLLMLGAAAARLGASLAPGAVPVTLAALLWSAALCTYLGCFARTLVAPSLPRAVPSR